MNNKQIILKKSEALAEAYARLEGKKQFSAFKFPNLIYEEDDLAKRERELLQISANKSRMKIAKP